MAIHQSKYSNIVILEPSGNVDARSALELEQKVLGLLNAGSELFVVDCSHVDQLAGSGIRVLVMLAKRLAGTTGQLVLCSLSHDVEAVLDIAGLSRDFPTAETKREAISELFPHSELGKLSERVIVALRERSVDGDIVPVQGAGSPNPRASLLADRVAALVCHPREAEKEAIPRPSPSTTRSRAAGEQGSQRSVSLGERDEAGSVERGLARLKAALPAWMRRRR